ncbi:hypothetical protein [Flavobacterium sp.]|uniref:hypothetical protein n=1 Tax=Flavobacterium sp. TaxID=239 RepID=UPI003752B7F4
MTLLNFLQNSIVGAEGLSAFVGLLYYKKVENTYWKYLVWYCLLIFLNELFSLLVLVNYTDFRGYYYDIYGIPIQFLFLFWLFAKKSLQLNKLYTISVILYLCSFLPHFFYKERYGLINSMSYTIGCFFLLIMCVLEFLKQIKSDDILNFKTNRMFYINLGVLLFYIGTMPFYTFMKQILESDVELYKSYRNFSVIAGIILYLLFTLSFICGKQKK